ncbi:MAG: hypothetical protein ABWZ80_00395 [Beijerinckiaceae bacterium]
MTALAATPALAFAAAAQGARCTSNFTFVAGGVTEVEARTPRDQTCVLNYGRRSAILSYALVNPPARGIIGSAGNSDGRYRTAYRPNPGYVGPDVFEVDIRYIPQSGQARNTRVRVRMTVQP